MAQEQILGINGLGRIGKMALWWEAGGHRFDRIVVNTGRQVGRNVHDLAHYIAHDSTYGSLARFLHGARASGPGVRVVDADAGELEIDGTPITLLLSDRDPRDIAWQRHGVRLVVDTTGKFLDPNVSADAGSVRGHLEAGAAVVVTSAAFKLKTEPKKLPDDAVMLIYGVNHHDFDPSRYCIVSAASCTTTALAHMMKPLLDDERTRRMLTASMSTIHAATNSQSVLDNVPKSGAKDLRKSRSALNNIILTSTGAARALEPVLPDMAAIGFLADSVRVPIPTASLIILNCTFQSGMDEKGGSIIDRDAINGIYRRWSETPASGISYTEQQNVSTDMIAEPHAVVIEAHETHTRTGFLRVDSAGLGLPHDLADRLGALDVPVTHAKIFGWYDNEHGSYTVRMSQLIHHIADQVL